MIILLTYRSAFWFGEWSTVSVDLEVEATGVAQVMSTAISSPKRSRFYSTIHTLSHIFRTERIK